MTMNRSKLALLGAALVLRSLGACAAEPADEKRTLSELRNTVVNLLQGLVEQGIIPREKAEQMVRDAQAKATAESAAQAAQDKAEAGAVRVPYVPQIVKDELRKQVAEDLSAQVTQNVVEQAKAESWGVPAALPEWVRRMNWSSDLRLRLESDMYASDNAANTYLNYQAINQAGGIGKAGVSALLNTTEDQQRLRFRLRMGFTSDLGDGWTMGARIASGDLVNPGSANQTLGSGFARDQLGVDLAYVQWTGKSESERQSVAVTGGRMVNPWLSTNLVWADDLRFDGVAASYRFGLTRDNASRHFLYATLGAFPVQQVVLGDSKMLYAGQLGADWTFDGESRLRFGASYYQYQNVTGRLNPFGSNIYDYTAPQYMQVGNTLFDIRNGTDPNANLFALAAQFHLVDVTGKFDWRVTSRYTLSLTGDYVKNVGYDAASVAQLVGSYVPARTAGLLAELGFGSRNMAAANAWRFFAGYRSLQRDAVIDAFTDQDMRLGGTDIKGYYLGADYGINSHVNARLRYLSGSQIDGPPLAIDVLLLDLTASF
jgi:hypothetical protein